MDFKVTNLKKVNYDLEKVVDKDQLRLYDFMIENKINFAQLYKETLIFDYGVVRRNNEGNWSLYNQFTDKRRKVFEDIFELINELIDEFIQ